MAQRPRSPPSRRRLFGTVISVLAALGCGVDPAPPGSPRGWTRHDLTATAPADGDRVRKRLYLLGRGVPSRKSTPHPGQKGQDPRHLAGEIQALEGRLSQDLRFTLELGDEPFLSYVPLSFSEPDCPLRYSVRAAGADGARQDVHSHPAAEEDPFAPATVEISLAAFAGQRIELVLRLDPVAGACTPAVAVWGSPAVYSRRHVELRPGSAGRPNVVLLGLDTVRADALGVYGREPSPTPAIDRLASQSDVWLEAFSCFNVTNPSFASMMTGLYGKNHGVYGLRTPLGNGHTTLAELFAAAGYDTGAVLSARHLGHRQSGLGQGFASYRLPRTQNAAELSVDAAIDWIARRRRPFFLWLHLFDPHTPHTPPRPYAEGYRPAGTGLEPVGRWLPFRAAGAVTYDDRQLGGQRDLYLGEVAYLDRQVGRLLDVLEDRGLFDRTVVALVADHGENLGEHGIHYRHSGLWDTTTRVPLMIRWPGRQRRGRRIPGLAQTVDLFPTLLAAAGIEPPSGDGVDLGAFGDGRRRVFAEASAGKGAMVRTASHLLFQAFDGHAATITPGSYLYDLRHDPVQETNLAGAGLEVETELRDTLYRWLRDRRTDEVPAPIPLPAEQIERLRSLGYVDLP